MFSPGHLVYMDKIAVGPAGRGVIHIDATVEENLKAFGRAVKREVSDLTAVILDRPRNQKYVEGVRACGARLKLVTDGDVAAGISTALEGTGVDILFGIGGSPEGVITAAALKCLGGDMQCKLWPRDDSEREYAKQVGYDLKKTLFARRPGEQRQRFLLRDRHHRRRNAQRRALFQRRRDDRIARDAFAFGNDPPHLRVASHPQIDALFASRIRRIKPGIRNQYPVNRQRSPTLTTDH